MALDPQVAALATNLTTLTGLVTTYIADVAALQTKQAAAIDAEDEAAIVASNQSLATLTTNLQTAIAAIPPAPAPAPTPAP